MSEKITSVLFFVIIIVITSLTCVKAARSGTLRPADGESADECISRMIKEDFPLRRSWNEIYSRSARVMGQEELFGVYYDKNGGRLIKLFGEESGTFTDSSIIAVNDFYAAHPDIPIYTMIVPTASGIYRGQLPVQSKAADQQKLIDDIYYRIDSEITPLDVWGALYSARDDYVYFRTDDRWTPQGAYEAYTAAAPKMGLTPYGISHYDVDHTNVEFYGSLAELSGVYDTAPDMISVYRCKYGSYIKSCDVMRSDGKLDERSSVYSKSGLRSEDKYAYFFGTVHYKSVSVKTAAEDEPKLLVIGSDHAGCFLPFLAPHFSEIVLIDPYEFDDDENISDYAEVSSFDRVLFLCDTESFCQKDCLKKAVETPAETNRTTRKPETGN